VNARSSNLTFLSESIEDILLLLTNFAYDKKFLSHVSSKGILNHHLANHSVLLLFFFFFFLKDISAFTYIILLI
jgi:hypothetical protein